MEFNHLLELAEKQKNTGNNEEAIKICEKILCSDLGCHEALEEIGDNYLSLRDYNKAEKALIHALKINPYSANANYLLGFVYSAIEQWDESVIFLERADKIHPNHPEILRCLGWSIFHSTDRKKGIIILERALHLNRTDCLIMSDLGLCYLNEKNFNKATQLFNSILKIEPDNEKAKECLKTTDFFKVEYEKLKKI
ncbi:tetratricopeptide repeat protein [Patescibacteria group bacterium]|nr:tetratricopeptide repeat protein [Patescibacteria group bacterium]